ncbi:MAG: TIM barrel protein [Lentisphaerae bacterium]|nr:TIM barrel protein [Lentisphaerota bacterium]
MKLSFATLGCPDWKLDQIVQTAKALGYDGVDLRGIAGEHIGPDETPDERRRIRKLFADAGIEIPCIMGYTKFTWDDPAKLKESVDVGLKYVATARDIGCPMLRVFGGQWSTAGREESIRRVIEGVKPLVARAEKAGVKIAMETHDDWCKGENLKAVLDGIPSPSFGVCWDVANSFLVEPLEKTYATVKDRLFHVHYKDVKKTDKGEARSTLPGQGQVDLKKALRLIAKTGYKGYLAFEWEKKWEPALEEPEVAFPHYIQFTRGVMKELGVQ